ncbi:MAG TPA: cytochrome c [Steroidobacteraceae bacterium]|nr:cytochrome c [Steroidobacteraceae bacterium]
MSRSLHVLCVAGVLALAGCESRMQDMYDQPRYKPLATSPMFADGGASRAPVEGTEPHASGNFAGTSSGRLGTEDVARRDRDLRAKVDPYPPTLERLRYGRERYDIYCTPCHSPLGDGDGLIVRKGFPAPPSFHSDRLRAAADRHFFDVMSNGYGIMYSYANRLTPDDRWAVVTYIRALQLSQHATLAELTVAERTRLEAEQ